MGVEDHVEETLTVYRLPREGLNKLVQDREIVDRG